MSKTKEITPKALLADFATKYKGATGMGKPHYDGEATTVDDAIKMMEHEVEHLDDMFNDMRRALDAHIWEVKCKHTDMMGKRGQNKDYAPDTKGDNYHK